MTSIRRLSRGAPPRRAAQSIGSDLLALGVMIGVLLPLLHVAEVATPIRLERAVTVLSVAAVTGSGILLALTARLRDHAEGVRLASALIVSGMVVLPLGVMAPSGAVPDGLQFTRSVAVLVAAALFLRALRRRVVPEQAWPAAAVATATVLVAAGAAGLAPRLIPTGPVLDVLDAAGVAGTLAATPALLVSGVRRDSALLRRAGLALAVGHTTRLVAGVDLPADMALVLTQTSRAAAVGLLVFAVSRYAAVALRELSAHRADAESRLRAAEAAAADTADREHEIRNAVAGLSGAVAVLDSEHLAAADRTQLRSATCAEFERLRRMLERDPADAPAPATAEARVELRPLLDDLAAVHRASGAVIEAAVPAGLHAGIPREVLAQVVTNLLVNCAKHAPGARVWLRAARHEERARIEVADDGPGLPGTAAALQRRGVRGPDSTGRGLGLAISAELLAEHGGALRFEAVGTGCTAVVDVPVRAPRVPGPVAPPRERVGA